MNMIVAGTLAALIASTAGASTPWVVAAGVAGGVVHVLVNLLLISRTIGEADRRARFPSPPQASGAHGIPGMPATQARECGPGAFGGPVPSSRRPAARAFTPVG